MGRTTKFIKIAKKLVISIKNGKGSQEFLDFYIDFAKGRCFVCKERLYVDDFIKSGSGVEYKFRCGHKLVMAGFPEIEDKSSGRSYSRIGSNEEGSHDVYSRREGIKYNQDSDEIILAKSFCHSFYPELSIFVKDIQSSSIDIIGKTEDGKEIYSFQITKIDNGEYWKDVYQKGNLSRVMPEISKDVSNSILKKMKYALEDRNRIILLVDIRPGVVLDVARVIKTQIAGILNEADFKEVWLVGTTDLLTHRIY